MTVGFVHALRSQHSHVAQTSVPTIGAPAIGFELKSLDGKSLSLEGLRGQPVILRAFSKPHRRLRKLLIILWDC